MRSTPLRPWPHSPATESLIHKSFSSKAEAVGAQSLHSWRRTGALGRSLERSIRESLPWSFSNSCGFSSRPEGRERGQALPRPCGGERVGRRLSSPPAWESLPPSSAGSHGQAPQPRIPRAKAPRQLGLESVEQHCNNYTQGRI